MTRINLYPWRDAKIEEQKQKYIFLLGGSSVITFVFCLSMSWYYSLQVANQESNNEYLNNEIIFTNKKLREISSIKSQKQAILARLSVLQQLDRSRFSAVHLFNEISHLVNPLIVIKKIDRESSKITIQGYSDSNAGIAKFLRDIELSPYFGSAELNEIKVVGGENSKDENDNSKYFFDMKFVQLETNAEFQENWSEDEINNQAKDK